MTLEQRIVVLENKMLSSQKLLKGTSSTNQLNRLLILAQKTDARIETKISELEVLSATLLQLLETAQ